MHPSYREHKELARRLLYKALGVSKSSEATSIPRVSTERLHLFNQDPIAHGPGSGSAGLDISGASLRQWRDSAWNRALVVVLVSRAQAIECSYPGRFGSQNWLAAKSMRGTIGALLGGGPGNETQTPPSDSDSDVRQMYLE
ncbi:hypothetical protein PM082_022693 [Marasmius tenuissimus]|nr:hypothetical protein PM082_022693 [Marasmius tenuissimus]